MSLFRGRDDVYARKWRNKEGKAVLGVYPLLSDEMPGYHCLPRGCEIDLSNLFESLKVNIKWADDTFSGRTIKVKFNGQLRDEQTEAVSQMLQYDNGVLSVTTAFGKTVIGAKLIAERKVNTLVLVHTQKLLEQLKERLTQYNAPHCQDSKLKKISWILLSADMGLFCSQSRASECEFIYP